MPCDGLATNVLKDAKQADHDLPALLRKLGREDSGGMTAHPSRDGSEARVSVHCCRDVQPVFNVRVPHAVLAAGWSVMARPTGLEPATFGSGTQRSIH